MRDLLAQIRNVLHERAAARHVQHLHAAADRQNWKPAPARGANQPELEQVYLRLGRPKLGVRRGAVRGRLDVGPTRQTYAVETIDDRLQPTRRKRREDDRDPSGLGHGVEIADTER